MFVMIFFICYFIYYSSMISFVCVYKRENNHIRQTYVLCFLVLFSVYFLQSSENAAFDSLSYKMFVLFLCLLFQSSECAISVTLATTHIFNLKCLTILHSIWNLATTLSINNLLSFHVSFLCLCLNESIAPIHAFLNNKLLSQCRVTFLKVLFNEFGITLS